MTAGRFLPSASRKSTLLPWAIAVCALVTLVPQAAAAQPADRRTAAVRAFETGEAAAAEERWADAITAFREAYDLTGVPTALFNLAYALRALGRYVEARDSFDELLGLRLDADTQTEAQALRDEVDSRVAHVRLARLEPDVTYEFRLDGQVIEDDLTRPAEIDCDPGTHRVEAHRPGYAPFEWSGVLGEGQSRELDVEQAALPSGGNIAEEPWFWIVIGVVVVGGAVAGGLIGHDQAQLRPVPGRVVVNL